MRPIQWQNAETRLATLLQVCFPVHGLIPRTVLHFVQGRFQEFKKHSEKYHMLVLSDCKYQLTEQSPLLMLSKHVQILMDKTCIDGKLRSESANPSSFTLQCFRQLLLLTLWRDDINWRLPIPVAQAEMTYCHGHRLYCGTLHWDSASMLIRFHLGKSL